MYISNYGEIQTSYGNQDTQEENRITNVVQLRIPRDPNSLSMVVHKGIKAVHAEAMKNEFLNSLIKGGHSFCSKALTVYLCNLSLVHASIEKAQNEITLKYGKECFVFDELFSAKKLFHDIEIWSMFNTLSTKFSKKDVDSKEFMENVLEVLLPVTKNFMSHIDMLIKNDLPAVTGILYALYGTLLNGGQSVMRGLQTGYKERLLSPPEKDAPYEEGDLERRTELWERVNNKSVSLDTLAAESTSFLDFKFSISEFKEQWYQNLDRVPLKLFKGSGEEKAFEEGMVKEATHTIQWVLSMIEEMLETLKKEKI